MNNIKLFIEFWDCEGYVDYFNSTFGNEWQDVTIREKIDSSIFICVSKNWGIKRILKNDLNIHTYDIVDKDLFSLFLITNSENIKKYE